MNIKADDKKFIKLLFVLAILFTMALIAIFVFGGCAMLQPTPSKEITLLDRAADTAMAAATVSGLIPAPVGAGILALLGIGTAAAVKRGHTHKKNRIKACKALQDVKKTNPELVKKALLKNGVNDKKFYEKYVK